MRCPVIAVLLLCAGPASAVCTYPSTMPQVPDGRIATKEEMMATQQGVQDYVAKMEAYLACLEQEAATVGEEMTEAQKNLHVQRYNAAVDAMESLAAKYNVEVRAYKEAQR
jgi:hypothetical protein